MAPSACRQPRFFLISKFFSGRPGPYFRFYGVALTLGGSERLRRLAMVNLGPLASTRRTGLALRLDAHTTVCK